MALVSFANGGAGTFETTRFASASKNRKTFEIHGSGGSCGCQSRAVESSRFLDFSNTLDRARTSRSAGDDLKHPIFGNFWRRGQSLATSTRLLPPSPQFLECLSKHEEFHPNFADALALQEVLDAVHRSATTRQWTTV